jgi:hypothetical protein
VLSDAKEQHRAWELKQTFFDHKKKKPKSKDHEWEQEEEEAQPEGLHEEAGSSAHSTPDPGAVGHGASSSPPSSDSGKGGDENFSPKEPGSKGKGAKGRGNKGGKCSKGGKRGKGKGRRPN